MKRKLPKFRSDQEAEEFANEADVTEYDLFSMSGWVSQVHKGLNCRE